VGSESDFSRLPAGQVPVDGPDRGAVEAFLAAMPAAFPPASVDAVREQHLAAIAEEVRRTAAASRPRPGRTRRTRRMVVTALAAVLGLLTAGVGVATAMGGNPLTLLPGLRLGPPEAPRSAVPGEPTTSATKASQGPAEPRTPSAAPTPSSAPSTSKSDHATPGATSNNGKSAQAQASHKPTAKPSPTNNGRTDPPAKGKPSAPPGRATGGSEEQAGG